MWTVVFLGTMGALSFPISGTPQCRSHFTDGMLALHSFMYDRAHAEFQAAYKADRGCAMAHWGDAMAYNHPIWGEDDQVAAKKALADVEGATPREKAFLAAARRLFGDGDLKARLSAWLDAADAMHKQFPGDDEIALEHALALIANSERLSDQRKLMQAAAIGMDVLARKPNHPGAAHYIIHACDTPDHAVLALAAAERYAKIAPAASHALHMPSHIFVQLGMWERVARSNEVAWAASQKDERGHTIDKYDWHSYAWLASAYLELGQVKRAEKLLKDLTERMAGEDNAEPRFAYSVMAHLYLTDADAWERIDEVLQPIASHLPLETGESAGSLGCSQHAPGGGGAVRYPVGLMSQVRVRWVRAEAAMRRGDEAGVKATLDACKPVYEALEAWHGMFSPPYYERRKATENALLLAARARKDKGALDGAAAALKKLIEAGDPFANGPAFDPPAEQWLGDLYLATGKPKEALAAYDAALARHPRLSRSLLGAMRAAKAAGDMKIADARRAELTALWADADPEVRELLK